MAEVTEVASYRSHHQTPGRRRYASKLGSKLLIVVAEYQVARFYEVLMRLGMLLKFRYPRRNHVAPTCLVCIAHSLAQT